MDPKSNKSKMNYEKKLKKLKSVNEIADERLMIIIKNMTNEISFLKQESSTVKLKLVKAKIKNAALIAECNQKIEMVNVLKEQLNQNRKDGVTAVLASTMAGGFRIPISPAPRSATSIDHRETVTDFSQHETVEAINEN